jgi:hypothetical protein
MGAYADALDRWRADRANQGEAQSGPGGPVTFGDQGEAEHLANLIRALRTLGVGYRDQAVALVDAAPVTLTWRQRSTVLAAFPVEAAGAELDPSWFDMRTPTERVDPGGLRVDPERHGREGHSMQWRGPGRCPECFPPAERIDPGTRESAGTLPGDAERSRQVEDDQAERAAVEAELAAEVDQPARYRWTDHRTDRNTWCRWSHVNVSARVATSADTRCPAGCSASSIEVDPRPTDE